MDISSTNCYKQPNILNSAWLDTPLGSMLTISDKNSLYLLEFAEKHRLAKEIEHLRIKTKSTIIPGRTAITDSIEEELCSYFLGNLKAFKTPIHMLGSPFQKMVWQELMLIPYGETRSYLAQAETIKKPTAFRAVANANGANPLAIIIPCHRIINSNGKLGGYGGGIARKEWLINTEKQAIHEIENFAEPN
jgi:AraC family transcriptional regulator of adaptative response/methylated-DNA-[protein]-cysteine methyltransferase